MFQHMPDYQPLGCNEHFNVGTKLKPKTVQYTGIYFFVLLKYKESHVPG